jgi:AcrR family transcriptional regulator
MLQPLPLPCTVAHEMTSLPRPYHHGNLRAALFQTAEAALEEGGSQSISLRELARELGVSHTSPRRHFADKQALLDALALSGFERLDAAIGRATQNRAHTFKTRLTKLGQAYVAFALKHPALFALMFEAKHRPNPPVELIQAADRAYGHGPATFAAGQASGEVVSGDPKRLSLVAIAALQGLITISTNGKFKGIDLATLTEDIIERMIAGFKPRK